MTYQPKSYRKFLATSVAAAMVATVAAPAVFANETTAFTDTESVSSWAGEAINYLVAKGAIEGIGDDKFDPTGDLTRGQAAKILALSLDLTVDLDADTDFEDAASHWSSPYIKAIQDQKPGVINGYTDGTFKADGTITRQEMAKMTVLAYGLELEESAIVNFTDNNDWGKAYVEVLASLGVVEGVSAGKFDPNGKVNRAQSVVFVHRTEVESVRVDVAYSTPVVTSVSAINARELVVTFNVQVDKAAAETTTYYSLVGETISTAVLAEDGKTVTLTTADELEVANSKFTVLEIPTKADANVKTAEFNTLLTYADTVTPSIVSVTAKGTTAVVTFSEILKSEGAVSLNGSLLTAGTDYTVVGKTITITGLTAEKSYRVDVVGATDHADNMANPLAVNFTVAKADVDNTKPTVSATVNSTEITFDFSEELVKQNLDGGITADEYAEVTVAGVTYFLTDGEQDTTDKTKFTLDAASALGTETFIYTSVKVEGFKDAGNNTGDAFTFAATLQEDTTPPSLVTTSAKILTTDDSNATNDMDAVYLTFNEAVTVTGNFTLKSKNGIVYSSATPVALTSVVSGVDLDGNSKIEGSEQYTIQIPVDLDKNSTYTFELAGNSVVDGSSNVIADALTVSLTTGSFTAPAGTVTDSLEFASTTITPVDNNVFVLEYATDVDASALNASNYTLGGNALPYGTVLQYLDGTKKVRFTLPDASITASGTYILKATNVKDTDGNTLKGGNESATIYLKENVAPTATKVTVLNSKSFTVAFSEALANEGAPSGLTVKINGATVTPATAAVSNGVLTITTQNDFVITDNISVEFKSTNLVDASANKVKDGIVTK